MPLTNTLLITKEDLQNYVDFSQFVEDKRINAFIFNAQYLEVRPVLCNAFYAELLDEVANNTLSYANAELLNGSNNETFFGIKIWLAWLVYANYLPSANIKSTQSGMKIWNDTTSENAIDAKLEAEASRARQNAELYKNNVIEFLKANIENYPTWNDCNDCTKETAANVGNSRLSWINSSKY